MLTFPNWKQCLPPYIYIELGIPEYNYLGIYLVLEKGVGKCSQSYFTEVNGCRIDLPAPLPVPSQTSKQLNVDIKNMRCCLLAKLKLNTVSTLL